MHEASLMKDLMRKLDEIAASQRAKKIVGVSVWLGALSHMTREHFAEHFEQAAAGTLAEGARLDVTVSIDPDNEHAQDIRLESVELED
jgi:hydrogenase nickel incorporation protein HypA/HybF